MLMIIIIFTVRYDAARAMSRRHVTASLQAQSQAQAVAGAAPSSASRGGGGGGGGAQLPRTASSAEVLTSKHAASQAALRLADVAPGSVIDVGVKLKVSSCSAEFIGSLLEWRR
jgi:hypothetical protein